MRKVKVMALLTSLILLASIVMPIFVSIAGLSGEHTIRFWDDYIVLGTRVGVNFRGTQTIDENTEITLTNFNPATMEVYLSEQTQPGYRTKLTVNEQGKTTIATANSDHAPDNQTLDFDIDPIMIPFSVNAQNGKLFYQCDSLQEQEASGNIQNAFVCGSQLRIRGENRPITNLSVRINDVEQTISAADIETFKSNTGLTFNIVGKTSVNVAVAYDDNNGGNNQGPVMDPTAEDINFDVKFTDTEVNVSINNVTVVDDRDGPQSEFVGKVEHAGKTSPDKTNTITMINVFGSYPVTEFVINGVTYKDGDQGVTMNILDGGEAVEATIVVPGAESYTIRGIADKSFELPRTIIWANPEYVTNDKAWSDEFQLEHGWARVEAVYDEEGKKVNPNTYIGENSDEYGLKNDGFGWVKIKPGYKVIFTFVPEFGYQLTSIIVNNTKLNPGDEINQFVYTMPNTNVHFDAEFTKTDDIVKTDSELISSGEVSLGNNKFDGGTAQIVVTDVVLTQDKITNFEEAAGELEILNFVDVDLFQVFYKGKNDSDDVWKNQIEELDEEATITIQLPEGVDVTKVAIVHNIHDGDEYEIIKPISYDVENRTVTFKTKSFSNYAIALSDEETKEEEKSITPKTGDTIVYYAITLVLAVFGFAVLFKKRK